MAHGTCTWTPQLKDKISTDEGDGFVPARSARRPTPAAALAALLRDDVLSLLAGARPALLVESSSDASAVSAALRSLGASSARAEADGAGSVFVSLITDPSSAWASAPRPPRIALPSRTLRLSRAPPACPVARAGERLGYGVVYETASERAAGGAGAPSRGLVGVPLLVHSAVLTRAGEGGWTTRLVWSHPRADCVARPASAVDGSGTDEGGEGGGGGGGGENAPGAGDAPAAVLERAAADWRARMRDAAAAAGATVELTTREVVLDAVAL